MRILCFTNPFLPIVGGAERFLDELARRLSARDHEVTVLAARVRGADNRVDAPYRLVRYKKPFSNRWFPRHTVAYLLRQHLASRPDVVHAHGTYPQGYGAELYCRMTGTPWIVRPMGMDILPEERFLPRFRERIRKTVVGADRVVAQSAQIEDVVADLGVPRERIVRIANGVDMDAFAGPRDMDLAAPRIGMMAILAERKGFDTMVDALPAILARHPRARLLVAGEGRERERILEHVARLGLERSVELVGMVAGDAKGRFLRSLSVFVSASRNEGFSNAILEALAAGAPAVVTDVGGNREVLRELRPDGAARNGRLVPPDDSAALAEAVSACLADAPWLARASDAARETAREYSWGRVVTSYEELYASVASGGRAAVHT